MFSSFAHCGIAGVVTPMTATLTPPTTFSKYGANDGTTPVERVLADSHGKLELARAAPRLARP